MKYIEIYIFLEQKRAFELNDFYEKKFNIEKIE